MKALIRLLCAALLLLALPAETWARGRSGGSFGGGSSGGSRSSYSGGSSSRSSSWGGSSSRSSSSSTSSNRSSWGTSSRTSSSTSGGWGERSSAQTTRSAPSSSATDSALARKVGQGGSTFSSRPEAVRDFQQKYASSYPSTYSSQPTSRPGHIPQSTTINGGNYPVTYDRNQGGYGSWVGNRWSAYDVMRDAVMLNALMGQRNYAYNDYGGGYGSGYSPGYATRSSGAGGLVVGLICIVVLVLGAVVVVTYFKSVASVRQNPMGVAAASAAAPPPRDLRTSTMDKSKPADWLAVQPNSVVTVSDTQGIADSMKRGLGVRGIDYTVRSVAEMKQLDGLSTHLLFTLHDEEQATYLLVKIVDDLIDLGLYFEVDGLAPGSRQELLDRGLQWLFQEPANPNNFQVSDLQFTTIIKQTLPTASGGQEEILYALKGQGELQCEYAERPARSGMGQDVLATLVEYRAEQPTENPEFLVLETGAKRGGSSYVQFFQGCPIKFSEVDVLPA